MKFVATLATIFGVSHTSAFVPSRVAFSRPTGLQMAEQFDQEKFISESKEMRLKHLEDQAMYALKISCENYGNAVFPNAMIAGDVVSRFSVCMSCKLIDWKV
jgi:phosphoadenosine phosphosulfate reductase